MLNFCVMLSKAKYIKTVPQILPHEPEFDQAESQNFYFKSEELKIEAALLTDQRVILMDRNYVSTLAFYWSFDQIHGTKTYKRALHWYRRTMRMGKLVKPFTVFYIETPIELGTARKGRSLGNCLGDLWLNEEFLKAFISYYDYFYSIIERDIQVVKLSGKESLSSLKRQIQEYIHEKAEKV